METLMIEGDQSCDSSILVKCSNYKIQTLVKKILWESNALGVIPSCLLYHIAPHYPFKDSHHSTDKIQSV